MIVNKPHSTGGTKSDWLENRKKYVTASDAGKLLGVSPYGTPSSLMKEKTEPHKELDNKYIRRGLEHEEEVLLKAVEWLEGDLMEMYKDPNNKILYTNEETRISATPDGMLEDGRMIEVKTTGISNIRAKHPPTYYIMQCQVQMYVTGATENYLMMRYFYNWPNRKCILGADRMFKIEYNPEIIDILVDKVKIFWYCLKEGKRLINKKAFKEANSALLLDTCTKFKERIYMDKFEIEPFQLKIVKSTCIKAAAKLMYTESEVYAEQVVLIAKRIEKEIFHDIGEACADGGRELMTQIGAAVNGYAEVNLRGNVEDMKVFVIKSLEYFNGDNS